MLLQDAAPNGAPSEPRNATHSQLCCRVQCVVVQEDQVSLNDMRMWCLGAVLGTASTSPARGPLLALSKFWGARAHAHAQGGDRRLGANVRGATTGTASSDSSRTVLDVKDRRDSGRRNVDTEQRRGGEDVEDRRGRSALSGVATAQAQASAGMEPGAQGQSGGKRADVTSGEPARGGGEVHAHVAQAVGATDGGVKEARDVEPSILAELWAAATFIS